MRDLEQRIANWRREMFLAGIKLPATLDELENHLREQIAQLQDHELTDEERFRIATGKLGDSKVLKREFAKVEPGWRSFWNNAAGLNVLGAWFVFMGVSGFSLLPPLWALEGSTMDIRGLLCLVLCALHIVIGVGVMRRVNFWRWFALGWGALYLLVNLFSLNFFGSLMRHLVFHRLNTGGGIPLRLHDLSHWQLLLITHSADLRHVSDYLSPIILLWGAWLLTRRPMRELFQRNCSGGL